MSLRISYTSILERNTKNTAMIPVGEGADEGEATSQDVS
jgi:hypothetical protein